jgi:hypothetical protein
LAPPIHAQGQILYCAEYSDGSSPKCDFYTLQQCDESISGVGGVCINNPYLGHTSAPPQPLGASLSSSYWGDDDATQMMPMSVPPPPFARTSAPQQAAMNAPLALPQPGPPPVAPLPQAPPAAAPPCNPLIDGTYCATQGGAGGGFSRSNASMQSIQSVSNDLSIGGDPPATLGAISFGSDGNTCVGLFRRAYCN